MTTVTPWAFPAAMFKFSCSVWASNMRLMKVLMDAGNRQVMVAAGMAHPVPGTAAASQEKAAAPKKRIKRQPSKPPAMPDSNAGLEDSDLPV